MSDSTLAPARFSSTRIQDDDMSAYSIGVAALLLPGILMLSTLACCYFYTPVHRSSKAEAKRPTGCRRWGVFGVAAALALVALGLVGAAGLSARSAVGDTRLVYLDAVVMVDTASFQLSRIRNQTLSLADVLAPMIAGALALPLNSSQPEVDLLRTTASAIQQRIVNTPYIVGSVDAAQPTLNDARLTLERERQTVRSIDSYGSVSVIAVSILLVVLFAAGILVAFQSSVRFVYPYGIALAIFLLVFMPASTTVDDGCRYYGNLEARARETSALALACIQNTDLLVAAGASVEALSPDVMITFPIFTSVNTSSPLGNQTNQALQGINTARDQLAGLFAETRALREGVTCRELNLRVKALRDDLCAAPVYTYIAGMLSLLLFASLFASLFLWSPVAKGSEEAQLLHPPANPKSANPESIRNDTGGSEKKP